MLSHDTDDEIIGVSRVTDAGFSDIDDNGVDAGTDEDFDAVDIEGAVTACLAGATPLRAADKT